MAMVEEEDEDGNTKAVGEEEGEEEGEGRTRFSHFPVVGWNLSMEERADTPL